MYIFLFVNSICLVKVRETVAKREVVANAGDSCG